MSASDSSQLKKAPPTDTIAAIITPPGEGGIAALRIAGSQSLAILKQTFVSHQGEPDVSARVQPFLMRLGHYRSKSGELLDEIMALYMPAGRSYTGLDQVEIFCHGGAHLVKLILEDIIARSTERAPVRIAEPGEFTRLAFLSGRIDLAKAEAVAEMIAANTEQSYQTSRDHLIGRYSSHIESLRSELIEIVAEVEAALDFPHEGIEATGPLPMTQTISSVSQSLRTLLATYQGGRIVREGFKVVLGGRPNTGKSSLFNLLLQTERALVHAEAGTTRDYLSEWIDLGGFAINLIDTAGLRSEATEVEADGQKKATDIMQSADLILWLTDISNPAWREELATDLKSLAHSEVLAVGNKSDLLIPSDSAISEKILCISCKSKAGLADLEIALLAKIRSTMPDLTSGLIVTSARHQQKLSEALESLISAGEKCGSAEQLELVGFDLKKALRALEEITGRVYTEEILASIFSSFCIGK